MKDEALTVVEKGFVGPDRHKDVNKLSQYRLHVAALRGTTRIQWRWERDEHALVTKAALTSVTVMGSSSVPSSSS